MEAIFFESPNEFRIWLEKYHKEKTELIVGFYKVKTKKPSMTWSQSVDQALCFGWIDGIRKSIDDESYCIRFTPRRKNSIWSAVNIKKIEALTKANLMTPEGIKAYGLRKENTAKWYSYEKEFGVLDGEYVIQFQKNKVAWDFFTNQSPSYRKVITNWIMSAKHEKTRQTRLIKTINESERQKRIT